MRKSIRFFLLCILFAASCGKSPPDNIIPEDNFIPMLVDFHLVYAVQQSPDFWELATEVDSLDPYGYIFQKHGYTKAEFDTTISWYVSNPEFLTDVYNDVIMELTRIKDSIDAAPER